MTVYSNVFGNFSHLTPIRASDLPVSPADADLKWYWGTVLSVDVQNSKVKVAWCDGGTCSVSWINVQSNPPLTPTQGWYAKKSTGNDQDRKESDEMALDEDLSESLREQGQTLEDYVGLTPETKAELEEEGWKFEDYPHAGARTRRFFQSYGFADGEIVAYIPEDGDDEALWKNQHSDDMEDLDAVELNRAMHAFEHDLEEPADGKWDDDEEEDEMDKEEEYDEEGEREKEGGGQGGRPVVPIPKGPKPTMEAVMDEKDIPAAPGPRVDPGDGEAAESRGAQAATESSSGVDAGSLTGSRRAATVARIRKMLDRMSHANANENEAKTALKLAEKEMKVKKQ